jgi:predicted ArsR family transcriptional regulator
MEVAQTPEEDVLALPVRARLFGALCELRRPASTAELAEHVGRHPNRVRLQLQRLADAGLVEPRTVRRPRGRPRQEWAVARDAQPAGRPPQAHGQLGRWLARAIGPGAAGGLAAIETTGREIGRELAPDVGGRPVAQALDDVLTALGFAPRPERPAPDRVRFVLGNCPYRDAVRENQPAICTLHRGITEGLLDRLDPEARLADFVAKDPYEAGCLVDVAQPRAAA